MSNCNCTETMVDSDCRPEVEKVAKMLTGLSEKNQINLESFLKEVDFLEQRENKTA